MISQVPMSGLSSTKLNAHMILITGGKAEVDKTEASYAFNTKTLQLKEVENTHLSKRHNHYSAFHEGKVFILGGFNTHSYDVCNIKTSEWASSEDVPVKRYKFFFNKKRN